MQFNSPLYFFSPFAKGEKPEAEGVLINSPLLSPPRSYGEEELISCIPNFSVYNGHVKDIKI